MSRDFEIHNVDCIPFLQAMEPNSVDLAVFSPPFSSLYAYTDADADMGNSRESDDEFLLHFDFFCRAITPVIKPGWAPIVERWADLCALEGEGCSALLRALRAPQGGSRG